jgi:hypothetical protein
MCSFGIGVEIAVIRIRKARPAGCPQFIRTAEPAFHRPVIELV